MEEESSVYLLPEERASRYMADSQDEVLYKKMGSGLDDLLATSSFFQSSTLLIPMKVIMETKSAISRLLSKGRALSPVKLSFLPPNGHVFVKPVKALLLNTETKKDIPCTPSHVPKHLQRIANPRIRHRILDNLAVYLVLKSPYTDKCIHSSFWTKRIIMTIISCPGGGTDMCMESQSSPYREEPPIRRLRGGFGKPRNIYLCFRAPYRVPLPTP